MLKNIFLVFSTIFYVSAMICSEQAEITVGPSLSQTTAQTPKELVEKELKKNQNQLKVINKKLGTLSSKIEPLLNKIISSAQFKESIEKMATQQAADIAAGKSFEEVKYNHVLSNEFPKMTGVHKFLALIYSIMANIVHYQLLLEKLNATAMTTNESAKEIQSSVPMSPIMISEPAETMLPIITTE